MYLGFDLELFHKRWVPPLVLLSVLLLRHKIYQQASDK